MHGKSSGLNKHANITPKVNTNYAYAQQYFTNDTSQFIIFINGLPARISFARGGMILFYIFGNTYSQPANERTPQYKKPLYTAYGPVNGAVIFSECKTLS